MTLEERLEQAMRQRGYWNRNDTPQMKQLSLDAGLGETAVREILKRKKASPTLRTVTALAATLGVSVGWLLEGDEKDAPLMLPLAGKIENGRPLQAGGMGGMAVEPPSNLSHPEHLEAYVAADDSMVLAGIPSGATVYARPWWLHTGFFGPGSIAIFKERRDGKVLWYLRKIEKGDDGTQYATAQELNASLPRAVKPSDKCHKDTRDPESANTLCMYAIVEWAQLDCRAH